jgi:hypothetical protein
MFISRINSLVSCYTVLSLCFKSSNLGHLVSATDNKDSNIIKNQIANAIVKRIIRAYEEQEKFKVFVLMPLMPAFPADLSTKDAATAR